MEFKVKVWWIRFRIGWIYFPRFSHEHVKNIYEKRKINNNINISKWLFKGETKAL
jgi:hypothetical protein